MSLSVGIVGLPNVGKSTLFNALLKKQQAFVANFPFATIEPNVGIVPLPDTRLISLSQMYNSPIVPATVEFKDIAGLIEGASKGEGLGNKFLSHIRETSAICFVLRAFSDQDVVKQGVKDPKSDFEVLKLELELADLQTLEKQKDPGGSTDKELKDRWQSIQKLKQILSSDTLIYNNVSETDKTVANDLGLLSIKPFLVVLNVDEKDLSRSPEIEMEYAEKLKIDRDQIVVISAKTESELSGLSDEDQKVYLKDLGVENSGLERLIQKAFSTLNLITFLTAGEKEVRAWTIRLGSTSLMASGVIHTDFMKKFIKADVVNFDDFINPGGLASPKPSEGGWKNARDKGLVRSEGKDYIVKDGDVIEFKVGG